MELELYKNKKGQPDTSSKIADPNLPGNAIRPHIKCKPTNKNSQAITRPMFIEMRSEDIAIDEPDQCILKEEPVSDTSLEEPISDTSLEEPVSDTSLEEPYFIKAESLDYFLQDEDTNEAQPLENPLSVVKNQEPNTASSSNKSFLEEKCQSSETTEEKNKQKKKLATDIIHQDILLKNIEISEPSSGDLINEIQQLKFQLKEKDKLLQAAEEKARNDNTLPLAEVMKELQKLRKAVEWQGNEVSSLRKKFNEFTESFQPSTASSSTASNNAELKKAPIGYGLECEVKKLNRLKYDTNMELHEWCSVLLQGVYGNRAHLLRTKLLPGKSPAGLEVFSPQFLEIAKDLHEDWLKKCQILDPELGIFRPYENSEIRNLVASLPAYLSKRSYSLYLQETSTSLSKPKTRQMSRVPAPSDPSRPKRAYKKRAEKIISKRKFYELSGQGQPEAETLQGRYGTNGEQLYDASANPMMTPMASTVPDHGDQLDGSNLAWDMGPF